jgi:regulator of cell morphogenesis and NO signaling
MTVLPSKQQSVVDYTLTLNEIVSRYPDALHVLHSYGLDTCCGGALSLKDAVAHHGLDLAEIQAALSARLNEAA